MDTGIGKGILEIAMALIAIALIALIVSHASGTSQVISSGTSGFAKLLNVVTLQNQGFQVSGG